MKFESAQNNTTAKLPILKVDEYEMWVIRNKQYFKVQDYALWEVIENEKINKKNDVKARSMLLMALPNEHQLTFSQYNDAKTSTNDVNTANPAYEASTVSPNVNTTSPQVNTANFSDNTMYTFMVENPNGFNLLQQDLEKNHEDDLEAIDLRWQLSLQSMRAKRLVPS
nr:ribonuclease H-like domain-containing protein [Tanacetum cinerariifolium]